MQGRMLELNLHPYKRTTLMAANVNMYDTKWK
jgi:hypothetical protein